jgi:hypothetical protein
MTRRSFDTVAVTFQRHGNSAPAARVAVGMVVIHNVATAGHARALERFWRLRGHSAPGGMLAALEWLAREFDTAEAGNPWGAP